MASSGTWASGALASLSALLLVECTLDERPLKPLPFTWISSSGQGGDGEAGNPSPFDAGSGGGGRGGASSTGGTDPGGRAGSAAASAGSGGTGMSGTGGEASEGGTPGQPEPGCEDLDSDTVPDCQETLVKNGAFNSSAEHWSADTSIEQGWATPDANEQLESGSLTITNVTNSDVNGYTMSGTQQCVNITETGAYHFVAELFVPAGQGEGNGGVNLWFWNLPDCQGAILSATSKLGGDPGGWRLLYANPVTPMGSRSVAVRLVVAKPFRSADFNVSFDNVLFAQQ